MKRYLIPNQKLSTQTKRLRFDNPELRVEYDPAKFAKGPKIKAMKLKPGYRYPVRPQALKHHIHKLKTIDPFYFFNVHWIRLTNFIDVGYYGTFWWHGFLDLHPYTWDSDQKIFITCLGTANDFFVDEGYGSKLIIMDEKVYLSWKNENDLASFTINNVLIHEIGHSLASMRQERFDENLIEEFAQSFTTNPARHRELLEYWRESIISTQSLKKRYREWRGQVVGQ